VPLLSPLGWGVASPHPKVAVSTARAGDRYRVQNRVDATARSQREQAHVEERLEALEKRVPAVDAPREVRACTYCHKVVRRTAVTPLDWGDVRSDGRSKRCR